MLSKGSAIMEKCGILSDVFSHLFVTSAVVLGGSVKFYRFEPTARNLLDKMLEIGFFSCGLKNVRLFQIWNFC